MKYIFLMISMCIYIINIISAEHGHFKSKKEQLRDIVFADPSGWSHNDLIVFGLTCMDNDRYLRAAHQYRKAYILKMCSSGQTTIMDFLQWHVYGSRAEYKKIIVDPQSTITHKKIMIGRLELGDKGTIHEHFGEWTNFDAELYHKLFPFYNSDKRLSFFGHGWVEVAGYGLCGNIVCYGAGRKIHYNNAIKRDPKSAIRCVLRFKKQGGESGKEVLCCLSNFPYLLKAILDSGNYEEKKIIRDVGTVAWIENDCLVYDLESINIPDNYKEMVQDHKKQVHYSSFDQLPKDLACAITKRYQEQKR